MRKKPAADSWICSCAGGPLDLSRSPQSVRNVSFSAHSPIVDLVCLGANKTLQINSRHCVRRHCVPTERKLPENEDKNSAMGVLLVAGTPIRLKRGTQDVGSSSIRRCSACADTG